MYAAYLTITILAAGLNFFSATSDFKRPDWILASMNRMGVPERWLNTLGFLKALGAFGLLLGIVIPPIGVAAAIGLVLFFVGAIATAVHARWYAHLPFPTAWLLFASAALALRLASL